MTHVIDPRDISELYEVCEELKRATKKYGPYPTFHHGWAVIQEELDEMWDDVKANNWDGARAEAIQVASSAIRFCIDLDKMRKS